MRAARYAGARIVEPVEEVAVGPASGEVQVRVAFTGLCETDLDIVRGAMDSRVSRPHILGHETSGEVAAVGAGVTGWAIGDAVTIMPMGWDGDVIGIDSPGALQELVNVPAASLVRLPHGLRLDHAALVEPVAVAVHDVRRSGLAGKDKAVVIGGSAIGLLIATRARELDADVVITETDAARRRLIRSLGFATLDPRETDQIAWVDRWTDGAGADVVFNVSGSASALLGATRLARQRGTIVAVAIHPRSRELDLPRMMARELTLVAVRGYDAEDFQTALDLVALERVPANLLVGRVVPMSQIASAIADLESGMSLKVMVDVRDAS